MSVDQRAFCATCGHLHPVINHTYCATAATERPEVDLESAAYVLYVAQREIDSIPYTAPEALASRLRQVVPVGQELLDEIRRLRESAMRYQDQLNIDRDVQT